MLSYETCLKTLTALLNLIISIITLKSTRNSTRKDEKNSPNDKEEPFTQKDT